MRFFSVFTTSDVRNPLRLKGKTYSMCRFYQQ